MQPENFKIMLMKHLVTLLTAIVLFINLCLCSFAASTEKSRNKKKIILTHQKHFSNEHRDNFCFADATYDPDMGTVELACHETKETAVYIIDPSGQTVSYDTFDSSSSPFLIIDVPVRPGNYTLVIDSPVYYAEGTFSVE